MPAYLIVLREGPIEDAKSFSQYQQNSRGAAAGFEIIPRVIYGETTALEGEAPEGTVVLEFPTVEEAQAFYNSPAYQEVLPLRLKSAKWRGFIVDGV